MNDRHGGCHAPRRWERALDALGRSWPAALIAVLGLALFHFWGNTYSGLDVRESTPSLFVWLVRRWRDSSLSFGGGDYSHGWLVPLISAWFIWRRRADLRAAARSTSLAGLAVVIMALGGHWIGARAELPQASALALAALLWGVPFYLAGWPTARILAFPCAYLLFCIPWNFFDSVTFPLRLFATAISTGILNGFNIPTQRLGTAIYSSAGGGFNFDVADPCSGIRSLLAMMALTAAYAHLTQPTAARQGFLFLAAIPLAVIGNVARIVGVALVAVAFGPTVAAGVYHDYSGFLFYGVAVFLMLGIERVLAVFAGPWSHGWAQVRKARGASSP